MIFVLLLAALLVGACRSSARELTVQDAWARPANLGENGAAYFIIENRTPSNERLLSVDSDSATAAEIHMSMTGGNNVMTMQMEEAVAIPAKEQIEFKPGGLHVMLVGLTRDLQPGATITLTLYFKEAGSVTVEVPVKEF